MLDDPISDLLDLRTTAFTVAMKCLDDLMAKEVDHMSGLAHQMFHTGKHMPTSSRAELSVIWDPSPTPPAGWLESTAHFFFGASEF